MNRFTAINTTPVTQNVRSTVWSIISQFDAIGVNHQGLRMWNATVPSTSRTSATAITIRRYLRLRALGRLDRSAAPDRAERVHEVAVDRDALGLGMAFVHHAAHGVLLLLERVDQDQVLAGLEVVVEPLELLVLGRDADESAFPCPEQ